MRFLPLCWSILLLVGKFVAAKECGSVTRGKQVKELVSHSHVLVALLQDEEEDAVWKELCEHLAQTPEPRVADFTIVSALDHIVQRKVWDQSRPAPQGLLENIIYKVEGYLPFVMKWTRSQAQSPLPSMPAYVLFEQGSSFETASGVQLMGDEFTTDDVSSFVSKLLKRQKLGNFVYSLGTYDLIAAQTMELMNTRGQDHWMTKLWVHGVARMTRYLVQPTSLDFERDLAEMYKKCAIKVLNEGAMTPFGQIERLERMLNDGKKESIAPLQREKLSQRLYIWKRFSEPIEIAPGSLKGFLMRVALNLLSIMAIGILIPLVLFDFGGEEDEEAVEEEIPEGVDESVQHEEVVAKAVAVPVEPTMEAVAVPLEPTDVVTDDDPANEPRPLTKLEKQKAASAKAKVLMAGDKAKVQQNLARNAAAASNGTTPSLEQHPTYTSDGLDSNTVIELKEILRGLKKPVSGRKQELIDRILGAQSSA